MEGKKLSKRPTKRRPVRIGLDLDGVIIDKPPGLPNWALTRLVRERTKTELAYRYTSSALVRSLRWLTHRPLPRQPIWNNLRDIRTIAGTYEFYVISGRYSFLRGRTKDWLQTYDCAGLFQGVYVNLNNRQPHRFKESMIRKLKLEMFIDDDEAQIDYLRTRLPKLRIIHWNGTRSVRSLIQAP